jgi:hypothetical protein
MTWTRPFHAMAVILLLVSAFGGLSVGIPVLLAQLTGSSGVNVDPSDLLVPIGFLAYGLLSLAGAIAMLSGWSSATRFVVVPQALVTVGLVWVDVAIAADPSLLIVAGISGGAALCTLADAWTRPGR